MHVRDARNALALTAVLALAGCAWLDGVWHDPTATRRISYQVGACFGRCPQFAYRIDAEGQAVFVGERFTEVSGEHDAPGDRDLFKRLNKTLAEIRPDTARRTISARQCERSVSDQPTITVTWESAAGERVLTYDRGCHDPRYARLVDVLERARAMLPVDALVGGSR